MTDEPKRTLNDKFMLRLPDGMRDRIREAAEKNNRSMNAEIVARLEGSFSPRAEVEQRDLIAQMLMEHYGQLSREIEELRRDIRGKA